MASIFQALQDFTQNPANPGGEIRIGRGYTPEQQSTLNQLLSLGRQNLTQGMPEFAPIREQALNTFREMTQPRIAAEADSLMGSGQNPLIAEALRQHALRGLSGDLAAREAQFNQGNFNNIMALLNLGLTPQYNDMYQQPSYSPFQQQMARMAPGMAQQALSNQFDLSGIASQFPEEGKAGALRKILGAVGPVAAGAQTGAGIGGPWGAVAGGGLAALGQILGALQDKNKEGNPVSSGPNTLMKPQATQPSSFQGVMSKLGHMFPGV